MLKWTISHGVRVKELNCSLEERPAAYQLVGGVMAYQGYDG